MNQTTGAYSFEKMHGAGNDFVVLRQADWPAFDAALARQVADRHFGIGCDQLLLVDDATDDTHHLAYRIFNSDGSVAMQCGNGARCLVDWAVRHGFHDDGEVRMQSPVGMIFGTHKQGASSVRLSQPQPIDWSHPKLLAAVDVGNEHAVFLADVDDEAACQVLVAELRAPEASEQRFNIGLVQWLDEGSIILRVFERGAGETLACGSGAAAAASALRWAGKIGEAVDIHMPGGQLSVRFDQDGWPWLGGAVARVFSGIWHNRGTI